MRSIKKILLFKKLDKYIGQRLLRPDADICPRKRVKAEAVPMMSAAAAMPMQAKCSLEEAVANKGPDFRQQLFRLIDEKGLSNAEVYKKANIDRKLFSKIQCSENYCPSKKTAAALALALELDIDQAKDLLARAGYAFSPGSVFDLIIEFFIENKIYDIYTVNEALYEHDQMLL